MTKAIFRTTAFLGILAGASVFAASWFSVSTENLRARGGTADMTAGPAGTACVLGGFDPSFSSDGKDIQHIGPGDSEGYASALQADGKLVVAGSADFGSERQFLT